MRHFRTLARKYFELLWHAIIGIETLYTHGTHGPFGELNFGPLVLEINVVKDVYILNSSCTDNTLLGRSGIVNPIGQCICTEIAPYT